MLICLALIQVLLRYYFFYCDTLRPSCANKYTTTGRCNHALWR